MAGSKCLESVLWAHQRRFSKCPSGFIARICTFGRLISRAPQETRIFADNSLVLDWGVQVSWQRSNYPCPETHTEVRVHPPPTQLLSWQQLWSKFPHCSPWISNQWYRHQRRTMWSQTDLCRGSSTVTPSTSEGAPVLSHSSRSQLWSSLPPTAP